MDTGSARTIIEGLIVNLEQAIVDLHRLGDVDPAAGEPAAIGDAQTALGTASGHVHEAAQVVRGAMGSLDGMAKLRPLIDSCPDLRARLVAVRRGILQIVDPLVL
jgi:hypothetical protein